MLIKGIEKSIILIQVEMYNCRRRSKKNNLKKGYNIKIVKGGNTGVYLSGTFATSFVFISRVFVLLFCFLTIYLFLINLGY